VLGDILDGLTKLVAELLASRLGNFIVNALTPVLDGFIQNLLPKPLGIEGVLDVGKLLASISPGAEAKLEARAVPGGYVSLLNNGLSLGMIVGLNSDRDGKTRTADLDSEPALCVPPRQAPDFSKPPASLPLTSRMTFALEPAQEFMGAPDPASDMAVGVSETVLDLAGHHFFASGAMCLGVVGSRLSDQLNLGTIGILVPSIGELGEGKEPILLVLRPQQPVDMTIGDGTEESPRLTVHIRELDVDFYAMIYERFVRAFTLTLDLDAKLNLDFTVDDAGRPSILPTLIGLTKEAIKIKAYNNEFVEESAEELGKRFPAVLDLALPLLSGALKPFPIPEIGGFALENLQIEKVVTASPAEEFLAIYASLKPKSSMNKPMGGEAFDRLPSGESEEADTEARVTRVDVPPPELIRAALDGRPDGALPEIELALGGESPSGSPLEWQWRLNGGIWRPFSTDAHPVLQDPAFAIQGRYEIEVRARAVGDFRSFDTTPTKLQVVIDSVPPKILGDRAALQGTDYVVPAMDLVTEDANLEHAFAPDDDSAPTEWARNGGRISRDALRALLDAAGSDHVRVLVRDEQGNTSEARLKVGPTVGYHGRAPTSGDGCGCAVARRTSSAPTGAGLLLSVFAACSLVGRRVRKFPWPGVRHTIVGRYLSFLGLFLVAGFSPGCDCASNTAGQRECEVDSDCLSRCTTGTVPVCFDSTCVCEDDIEHGNIGTHSDLGVAPDGRTWVSAYNAKYGDLMVAEVKGPGRIPIPDWEFVDGVPDGPVVLPLSKIRGGIKELGDDVGMFTSLCVTPLSDPMISYYDKTNAALRFATKRGGQWLSMPVDEGKPMTEEFGGSDVGRYSSLTVSKEDDRPGIAYHAFVDEGGVLRTEVRYARAKVASPSSKLDWETMLIDQAALPEQEKPSNDIPEGIGLFLATARAKDGSPVVAYYDHLNGDLKVATWNKEAGRFNAPEVLDGADGSDVGWFPSIVVTDDDVVHVTYVDAKRDNLLYVNLKDRVPEVVDDGYRIDGMTSDGVPRPVFHLVGDDSGLVTVGGTLAVAYQDATTHELLLATRDQLGKWSYKAIAGDEDPFAGAYGFYASAEATEDGVVMSSYVLHLKEKKSWVEVFFAKLIVE
ncbi:MAG: hypothetical protein HY698_14285, partial [Deltaproteobacteria bacterium]|nr:hypothetical protein [Deltaproteobacteria bacterium]